MLAFIRKILFAALLGALVVFAYQNLEALSTQVRFRFDLYVDGWQFEAPDLPVVFLLVVCFLGGMLAAGFQGVYEKFARGADIRRRDKRIRDLEKEIVGLKGEAAELRPGEPVEGASVAELPAPLPMPMPAPVVGAAPPPERRRRWGSKPAAPTGEPPTL